MVDCIRLQQLGRRFQRQWLFRAVDAEFFKGDRVAVLGGNGSGKSSITSMIAGFLSPSEGEIEWFNEGQKIASENWWQKVAWCSPALDLPLGLSIEEVVELYFQMRGFRMNCSKESVLQALELNAHLSKPLSQLSSGMRQRVKLMLAFSIDAEVLILDEPTAHLDTQSIAWYKRHLSEARHHFVFVASNHDQNEIVFCNKIIEIIPGGRVLASHLPS